MNCEQIEELLSDLMDGELAEGARTGVEAHLASCERCAGEYKKLRRTVRFVRANSTTNLADGTPGASYMEFTRALVDAGYRASPEEKMVDGGFGPDGHEGASR